MGDVTDYDLTELRALGRKRQRLVEELEELRPELAAEIRKAALAKVDQVEIIRITGYSREQVRQASMSEEEREAEREKRRNRGKA